MQIGDLVTWNEKEVGVIVQIDPLHRDSLYKLGGINEIVVLRADGGLWYSKPEGWKVINETQEAGDK
tara:strand:- start:31 stop:231 length:201 start_codon:yes stop_codon:yes gene_type:complete